MPTLRFQGYSDDTFGEYELTKDDFDNCASGEPIDYLVTHPDFAGGVIVTGQHGRTAEDEQTSMAWQIGVAPHDPEDADTPMPDWPIRIVNGDRGYSPALLIDVPAGVIVSCLNRRVQPDGERLF